MASPLNHMSYLEMVDEYNYAISQGQFQMAQTIRQMLNDSYRTAPPTTRITAKQFTQPPIAPPSAYTESATEPKRIKLLEILKNYRVVSYSGNHRLLHKVNGCSWEAVNSTSPTMYDLLMLIMSHEENNHNRKLHVRESQG